MGTDYMDPSSAAIKPHEQIGTNGVHAHLRVEVPGTKHRFKETPDSSHSRAQTARKPSFEPQKAITIKNIHQFLHKVLLYKGSVSTVHTAVESTTSQKVVIKAYHKDKMAEKHLHKLNREIRAMLAMNGPNVAQLHTYFQDEENIYLIMELCEGGDLFKHLHRVGGHLDEYYACVEIIVPLLQVLERCHSVGILHRDIKPENIFLTRHGKLKLGDFGLAINVNQEIPFSRSGTLDYMAPEVLKNPATQMQESSHVRLEVLAAKNIRPYTSAVDVWAVGVLAYELICGRPPFEVKDEAQTAELIMYSDDIEFPEGPSPEWASFVRAALVKDPAMRPNASMLLHHPWVMSHFQRAVVQAVGHRSNVKEDLPLRAQSVQRTRPDKDARASPPPPSTPTHVPAPRPNIMRTGTGLQESRDAFGSATTPDAAAAAGAQAAAVTPGSSRIPSYPVHPAVPVLQRPPIVARASPLSKPLMAHPAPPMYSSASAPGTPETPAAAAAAAAGSGQALQALESAMQRFAALSDPGASGVPEAVPAAAAAPAPAPQERLQPACLDQLLQEAAASGTVVVHAARAGSAGKARGDAQLIVSSSANGSKASAFQQRLAQVEPPSSPGADDKSQASPCPAGPGIRERMLFHLSRQHFH